MSNKFLEFIQLEYGPIIIGTSNIASVMPNEGGEGAILTLNYAYSTENRPFRIVIEEDYETVKNALGVTIETD